MEQVCARLGRVATVVDAGNLIDLYDLLADLAERGIRRLMVEGGSSMHTQFLTAGLADEAHLVVAPFFVGNSKAPRFVGDGDFPWNAGRRATLVDVQQIEEVVLLRYALSDRYGARGGLVMFSRAWGSGGPWPCTTAYRAGTGRWSASTASSSGRATSASTSAPTWAAGCARGASSART